jgi:methionyl-tRNA formyltransferase
MQQAKWGCVGFHPTMLPEGRGRAPIAWLTLLGKSGAATFFCLEDDADSGAILCQEPFSVDLSDSAEDVMKSMNLAIERTLDQWLPRLRMGEWGGQVQDHKKATYYGKRNREDGLIEWNHSAAELWALVRSSSKPYPGAFTYLGSHRLIVWRASIERERTFLGVIGRILEKDSEKGLLVQTGNGLLWLSEYQFEDSDADPPKLMVGKKLGLSPQWELHLLRKTVENLKMRLDLVERQFKK